MGYIYIYIVGYEPLRNQKTPKSHVAYPVDVGRFVAVFIFPLEWGAQWRDVLKCMADNEKRVMRVE